jgi:predicted metal-binding membrane protein
MNTLAPEWRTRPRLFATCVLVFAASTWVTILWCGAACDMPGMGAWDRMPDQTRFEHFLVFEGMWMVMMVAMMMPVFAPALLAFRGRAGSFAAAYFTAWALPGVVVYPLGVGVSGFSNQSAAWDQWPSLAGGVLVMLCGWLQFTSIKRRQIDCCSTAYRPRSGRPPTALEAWRQGWHTGVNCVACCAGLTATLLVVGVMDLLAMAAVTLAVAAERLMPTESQMVRKVGWILLAMGVFLLARAATGG